MHRIRHLACAVAWLALSTLTAAHGQNPPQNAAAPAQTQQQSAAAPASALSYRGIVTFGGLPLPGATITATQGTKTETAVSDETGAFAFDDLTAGKCTIEVQMQAFVTVHADVTIVPDMPPANWELKTLPPDQIQAQAQIAKPAIEVAPLPAEPAATKPAAQQSAQSGAQANAKGNSQSGAQANAQGGTPAMPAPPEENDESADGFLVQGSVNNAATSQYATNPAFGNTRAGSKALYTGGFVVLESNSALNARQFVLSGVEYAKPSFNNFTGVAILQGPIRIPRLMPRGPNFFIQYQWTRNSNSQVYPGIVPTPAEQSGDLRGLTNVLGQPLTVYNPVTGQQFVSNGNPGIPNDTPNVIPAIGPAGQSLSPQAAALLKYYPQPNITGATEYNYQAPYLADTHQDAMNSRLDKQLGRKDQLYGGFAFSSTRADSVNLFDFVDESGTLGLTGNIHWMHRIRPRILLFTGYTYSRLRSEATPYFENRINVSGDADINGNDQNAAYWGPPALNFSSGIAGLSDGNSSFNRAQTNSFSAYAEIYHGKHNITVGGDFRKQNYNYDYEQNPRGSFSFTGAATSGTSCAVAGTCGSDLADFLIGVPDTSSIAFGNAGKYFREPVYDAYFTDDWRVMPILTINAGARWDYSAPISELFGNLVNLDVASGFTNVAPVLGSDPVGSITGQNYPASLMRPERRMIEPQIGISWRPIPASTLIIKAGYGLRPDTSVYQNIVLSMAQQYPLSKSQSAQNSAACPLTLANGFAPCSAVTSDIYGVDPNFRIGYVQTWQLQLQRDLPFAMQMVATYMGIKGTHGPQEFLPNSYPIGEANPCPGCPSGFAYETSNGSSIKESGQMQLRRRLRSGFSANLTYTYSKSLDDDAYLGGAGHQIASSAGSAPSASLSFPSAAIAQNWLDPKAERSLSSFDQRQLLSAQAQYTSGQGLEGGTLLGGWRGKVLKEWTVLGNVNYGTGMPQTPSYPIAVPGAGSNLILRPNLTGSPIYLSGTSPHLNAAAYGEPTGQWGTAGRDSITGPDQFSISNSLQRTFRPHGKIYLDFTVNATNTLNHVTYSSWTTAVTSNLFGDPASAAAMRSLSTSIHLRWQ